MATRRQPLIPGWLIPGVSAATLVVGTLLFTLGVSLYLKTRMGVAPIDAVAPIASQRLPFSFTACRMTQDISVTVLAVLAGGNALLALLAFLAMGRRDIDVLKSV